MADKSLQHGNYRHPGTACYDADNREWVFARQFRLQLEQIRTIIDTPSATTLATAPARFPLPQTSVKRTKTRKHTDARKRTKDLVKSNPHLSPALELLPELDLSSAAISSTYDPLIGNLSSFGSITLGNKYETPRRVAALAIGEAGNILQLAIINKEIYDWGQGRKTLVEGPTLKEAPIGYWNEEAAPIQQICFSQSEDRSHLLAVRLPTRTVLLRPIYHREARMGASSSFYDLPASVIEPHPVLTVYHKDTGGSPHVDFAFNPDYQLQFALVDQDQIWSVWNVHHPRKGNKYFPSRLARGRINKPEDTDASSQDGWARILWVANPHTLLVCNRRHLGIISIRAKSHMYHPCPSIFSEEQSDDWILDVKRHPQDQSQLFVLTSSLLILMAVTISSDADAGADEVVMTRLQSWKHCRDAKDLTLQMEVQLLSDKASFVILYSTLNSHIQVHSYSESTLSSSAPVACSDPTLLSLCLDKSVRIRRLHAEFMQQEGAQADVSFFRLFVMQSNGGMQELVMYASSLGLAGSDQAVSDFKQSAIKHPRAGVSKKTILHEEDDFVVPDRVAFAGAPHARITSQLPRLLPTPEAVYTRYFQDFTLLAAHLLRPETVDEISDRVDIVQIVNEVRQMLTRGLDLISRPLHTLMEYSNMRFVITDLDEASSKIGELFSLQNCHETVQIRHIASGSRLGLTAEGNTTISDVYDSILERWVAPLPYKVPVRVRYAKERLAQQVAAELVLSSTRVREHVLDDQITSPQHASSQDSAFTLPTLPSQEAALHPSSRLFSSQALPTLSPASLPGSSPPIPLSTNSMLSDPLTRLGIHLRCQESSKNRTSTANSQADILAHWQPGTDPRTYDWIATERDFYLEANDEVSQQQRKKERKSRERREKRQQRENERMRLMEINQSNSFPRSSPGPTLSGMGNSSQMPNHSPSQSQLTTQTGGSVIPQSQIERGKFGGRPEKKKKKKARISGF